MWGPGFSGATQPYIIYSPVVGKARAPVGTGRLRECVPFTPISNKTKPLSPSLDRQIRRRYRLARRMARTIGSTTRTVRKEKIRSDFGSSELR